jgi:hypothetical protein
MGFFSNMGNIGKINILLKQIEPKVDAIQYELSSPYPNINRIKVECGAISVLMSDIMDIADRSSNSVKLAPYYLFGKKRSLIQISAALAGLIEGCERL